MFNRMKARVAWVPVTIMALSLTHLPAQAASDADLEFFETDVRPLLAERCYKCHSDEKQKGGLRLDHISFINEGGDQGPALIPAKLDESILIEAIEWSDPDFQMPPKKKLSDDEIATLKRWVELGAPWPEEEAPSESTKNEADLFDLAARKASHWAWAPVTNPTIPQVDNKTWSRNPIDAFVLDTLTKSELSPAPRADKRTLIRRLYFDLIGLPPSSEDVEAFVNDTSPKAYENLVDALLANPAYGERWGRHWMDLTRFAETYGHEGDYPIAHAWQYRDYVIRALNMDLPYNDFVREQIAGDLLPEPRMHKTDGYNESIIGTGWWYMHQATHSPVDVFKDEADRIDNQIDVLGKAFLGMHISCARCHDHKFDAISTKDYYAITGYARATRQQFAFIDRFRRIEAIADELSEQQIEGLKKVMLASPKLARSSSDIWDYLYALEDIVGDKFDFYMPKKEGEKDKKPVTISKETVQEVAQRHGLDKGQLDRWAKALIHPRVLNAQHPFYPWAMKVQGRSLKKSKTEFPDSEVYETFDKGNFNHWYVTGEAFGDGPTNSNDWSAASIDTTFIPAGVAHSGRTATKLQGVLRSPTFTITHDAILYRAAGRGSKLRLVINSYQIAPLNGLLFRGTMSDVNTDGRYEWFTQISGLSKFKGKQAYIEILDEGDGWIAVDEIRFANSQAKNQEALDTLFSYSDSLESYGDIVKAYRRWAKDGFNQFKDKNINPVTAGFMNFLVAHNLIERISFDRRVNPIRQAILDSTDELPIPLVALATTTGSPETPKVFIRGNHTTRGDEVPTRFLEALGGKKPEDTEKGRLQLAEEIVRADNPLTSRVMVNRMWHHLFGRGIVESVDNFGVLGRKPSHPELLDYLATQFQNTNWSMKSMIRQIVLSETYAMSSELDTENAQVAKVDPDNTLLHRQNVRRLQGEIIRDTVLAVSGQLDASMYGNSIPAHLYPQMTNHRRPKESGPVDADRRRSIYMRVQRNFLSPMILAFDMPLPDTTAGKRTVSNVPAQSLILMNDPFVVDQAQAWAISLIERHPESLEARVKAAYLDAFGRQPSEVEQTAMLNFVSQQAQEYALPEKEEVFNLDLWKDVCQVLFMSKEFIYIG